MRSVEGHFKACGLDGVGDGAPWKGFAWRGTIKMSQNIHPGYRRINTSVGPVWGGEACREAGAVRQGQRAGKRRR